MVILRALLAVFCVLVMSIGQVSAKRLAPPPVAPVVFAGVRYEASHGLGKMGVVEAYDVATGKKLWEKRFYKIKYDRRMEKDVQDVFIVSLRIENGKLIVVNEDDNIYEVDLISTKEIDKNRVGVADWRHGDGICQIHGIKMKTVVVNGLAGSSPSFIPGYYEAKEKSFPHGGIEYPPALYSDEKGMIYVCPKCEQARKDWLNRNK